MDTFVDPEEKIICPYNEAHHIMRKRMNTHLVKCKKNYPNTKLVECDFNVIHKIPEPELQYHHENCPDRQKMEISVYQEAGTEINKFPISNNHVPTDESWDDLYVPNYDPKKHCENKPILRHLDVAPPSQLKEFKMKERKRIGELTNSPQQPSRPSSNSTQSTSSRRDLPYTRDAPLQEDAPDCVGNLLMRIKNQAGQSFLPKKK